MSIKISDKTAWFNDYLAKHKNDPEFMAEQILLLNDECEARGQMLDDASRLLEVTDDYPVKISMRDGKPHVVVMTGQHYTDRLVEK
jgi:hypothetical protein